MLLLYIGTIAGALADFPQGSRQPADALDLSATVGAMRVKIEISIKERALTAHTPEESLGHQFPAVLPRRQLCLTQQARRHGSVPRRDGVLARCRALNPHDNQDTQDHHDEDDGQFNRLPYFTEDHDSLLPADDG
jgi:hypothetical protein